MESKSIYSSKTFWCAVVTGAAPLITTLFPPVGEWLSANADWVCTGLGIVFGGLRMVTNKGVS